MKIIGIFAAYTSSIVNNKIHEYKNISYTCLDCTISKVQKNDLSNNITKLINSVQH